MVIHRCRAVESEDEGEGSEGEEDDNRRRQEAPPHASGRRWRDDEVSDIDLSSESEEEEDDDDVEAYQDSELATELFGVKINRGQKQGEEDEDDGGDGGNLLRVALFLSRNPRLQGRQNLTLPVRLPTAAKFRECFVCVLEDICWISR